MKANHSNEDTIIKYTIYLKSGRVITTSGTKADIDRNPDTLEVISISIYNNDNLIAIIPWPEAVLSEILEDVEKYSSDCNWASPTFR